MSSNLTISLTCMVHGPSGDGVFCGRALHLYTVVSRIDGTIPRGLRHLLCAPPPVSQSPSAENARVFHAKGAPHPVPGWARTLSRSHPRPDAKAWLLASPSSAQSFLAMFGQGKGQRGDGRKEMNRIGEAVAKKGYLSEWFPSDVKTKSRGGQSVSQCIHINCTVVCYPSAVPIT